MNLSLRLKKIADMVEKNSKVLDVGTDHAYIPIYLCKSNIIQKCIASDISKGPLESAKKNVTIYNLQSKIEVRQGNGIKNINIQDNIDTCIISGMGGALIIKILEDNSKLVDTFSTLILQPQKSVDKVRKYLHKINFKIVKDEMIKEDDIIYTIIMAKRGIESHYSEEEYLFGKYEIEQKSHILREYISNELYKMENIIQKIEQNHGDLSKIQKKYHIYKEIQKCLQDA